MAKLTLTDVASGYATASQINANNALIEAAIENTLSRDGTATNTMGADLDMNSHKVVNVTDPNSNQDAATKAYVDSLLSGTTDTGSAQLRADLADSSTSTNGDYLVAGKRSETNAAAFTLHAFTQNRSVNLKTDYSAVGDGATNDTTAIQNAIDDLTAVNGGIIFCPAGTYKFTTFDIKANVHLVGEGVGVTVFDASADSNAAKTNTIGFTGSNGGLCGCTVIGALDLLGADGSYGRGIEVDTSAATGGAADLTDIFIKDVEVKKCQSIGVHIRSADSTATNPSRIYLENVYSHNHGSETTAAPADHIGEGFQVTGGTDVVFKTCVSEQCGNTGFNIEHHNANQRTKRIKYLGCIARDNGNIGFNYLAYTSGAVTDIEDVKYIGCSSDGTNTTKTAATLNGAGFNITTPYDVTLVDCISKNHQGAGFMLDNDDLQHARLIGCLSKNNGQNASNSYRHGFSFVAGSDSILQSCVASDDQGTETQTHGLALASGTDNAIIDMVVNGYATAAATLTGSAIILQLFDVTTGLIDTNSIFETYNLNAYQVNINPRFGGSIVPRFLSGTGSPESQASADIGSLFSRTDGAGGTSLYVKESGTGNTGWSAVRPRSSQTYTPSNVTTSRTFDADTCTTADLADIVGTLIADLQGVDIIQ